jgi:photosystem II stability/assembly factor-like uncharacterized protein
MLHYVYVGVPQWTATASAGMLGGLICQEVGASSQDLGETWRRFDHHVTPRRTMMAVAVSRRNPRCVYAVNSIGQVFGTRDGGETWQEFPLPTGLRNVYTVACA